MARPQRLGIGVGMEDETPRRAVFSRNPAGVPNQVAFSRNPAGVRALDER